MGVFDFFKKDKVIKDLSAQVKALQQYNTNNFLRFNNLNRNIALFPEWDIHTNSERYATTDDIYSIVRMLATTAAMIPIYAYQVVDEVAQKKLNRIKQPHNKPYEVKALQVKALEELPGDDRVEMLMENPCEYKSKFEFYEAIYTFLFLYGEAFILKERPVVGVNSGLTVSLHPLYPQNIILKVSGDLPRRITGYDYKVNGVTIYENLPVEDIIHLKYFNPTMDYLGTELRGLSPLQVLAKRLGRMDANLNTSVAQMQNGGVQKIVWDENDTGVPFTQDGKEVTIAGARKDNFYRFLKNPGNYGAPFFAAGKMGVIDIGSTLDEMGILEIGNIDFKKLCNAYGTSDILFNSDVASTESNVTVMEKRTYTNTVLPNVYRVRDALKAGLLEDFEKGRRYVKIDENGNENQVVIEGDGVKRDIREDISEIHSLQEDMGKMVAWMQQAWWILPNEKRLMMKYDEIDNPLFNEPLIPTGMQTTEDFQSVEPLDIVTEEGN